MITSILRKKHQNYEKLINLTVSKVHCKCNGLWYVQKEGLEMGTFLPVMPAKFWLIEYEPAFMKEVPKLTVLNEDNKEVGPRMSEKGDKTS